MIQKTKHLKTKTFPLCSYPDQSTMDLIASYAHRHTNQADTRATNDMNDILGEDCGAYVMRTPIQQLLETDQRLDSMILWYLLRIQMYVNNYGEDWFMRELNNVYENRLPNIDLNLFQQQTIPNSVLQAEGFLSGDDDASASDPPSDPELPIIHEEDLITEEETDC